MEQARDQVGSALEAVYQRYNHRCFVHPDPLEFVYEYEDPGDREIVALLAAGLAYGRVAQILRSVRQVLDCLGPHPRRYVESGSGAAFQAAFASFKHRWTTGREVADLLVGVQRVLRRHGSLGGGFLAGMRADQSNTQPALCAFVEDLRAGGEAGRNSLLPAVAAGGACKRMHLFLRWMVRQDEVDPGGWPEVSPRKLIIPLDTHMHRLGLALGLTSRRQGDIKTALEITAGFAAIRRDDPVRYDFALTRFGIREELDEEGFLKQCEDLRAGKGGRPCLGIAAG